MRLKNVDIMKRAWELHRANGHPKGYVGPCWGPTMEEIKQAKQELTETKL